MPVSFAKDVYRRLYWDAVRADELPSCVRYLVFDGAVNSGPVQSVKWLQRAIGVFDDGKVGPKTIAAAHATPEDELARKLLAQRLRFMTELKAWSDFSRGWARRIADLMEAA
jgi:lysozyme family protein